MKILAKIIIIFSVFLIGFYYGQNYSFKKNTSFSDSHEKVINDEIITASIMLDFGESNIKVFNSLIVDKDTSVFKLLKEVTRENGIEFEYKDYGDELGVFVVAIGAPELNRDDDNKYWQYWVNNQYAKISASRQYINDGDIIQWKYFKGQINE